jgi:Protein of unknown function (DUF1289)
MKFKPCTGACTDDGQYCEGCGRSHQEIDVMRKLVEEMVVFYKQMDYENLDDFANAVAGSIKFRMGVGRLPEQSG